MRILLFTALFIVCSLELNAQKIYITRETASKVTKRLEHCRDLDQQIVVLKKKLVQVGNEKTLIQNEKEELEKVIAVFEEDYQHLEAALEEALKHLSKRKRRKLGYDDE
jgi:predicted  nucleic acid-binding Zn-ribbon protein